MTAPDEASVEVKVAAPEDAAGLLALLKQLQTESTAVLFSHLDQLTVAKEAQALAQVNAATGGIILLAVLEGQPIGLVTVMQLEDAPGVGELGIAVRKDYWHQGVGSLLLDEALYWFVNYAPLDHLVLDVYESNVRAKRLYEHYGFVVTNHLTLTDAVNKRQPALAMEYQGPKE